MNTLHPAMAAFMGLGGSELGLVLMIMLASLAVPVVLVLLVLRWARSEASNPVSPATHKKCPDCAEFVLIEARVCKHCGFRFDRAEARNT
jgi:hypothetical protein